MVQPGHNKGTLSMPTLVISIDGAVIKEVQLAKERTTLGRRPYNDIVIDNLAVSGEHAVLSIVDGTVIIEDLRSTNGTYVNGQPIRRQPLNHGDLLDIGKYKIRFVQQQVSASSRSALAAIAAAVEATRPAPLAEADLPSQFSQETPSGFDHTLPPSMAGLATRQAAIRMLNGNAAGRERLWPPQTGPPAQPLWQKRICPRSSARKRPRVSPTPCPLPWPDWPRARPPSACSTATPPAAKYHWSKSSPRWASPAWPSPPSPRSTTASCWPSWKATPPASSSTARKSAAAPCRCSMATRWNWQVRRCSSWWREGPS